MHSFLEETDIYSNDLYFWIKNFLFPAVHTGSESSQYSMRRALFFVEEGNQTQKTFHSTPLRAIEMN